jgi:N-acetyl sugar amidotransferase
MNIFWCKNCLNASTRPRISFDNRGWCNACQWAEEKKSIDWGNRQNQLIDLINKHKNKNFYDCLVAVSGGKDGSYVAYNLKNKYNLNVLCITVRPPLSLEIGDENLKSFINSGYEHLLISPDNEVMRRLDTIGFLNYGQGYYGWLIAIHSAVLRVAELFNISLVFYSEDGEIEYGGSTERKYKPTYGIDYMKKAYLNSTYEDVILQSKFSDEELYWFTFNNKDLRKLNSLEVTHFSFYESWDPYRNYMIAKEFCGFRERNEAVVGTFTNFAQNDQKLASLHYYLMYLKFGFGRATQDAGIEIRRGALTREQGINLVNLYDNQAPEEHYKDYCEYYKLTMDQFVATIDKFANKDLFEKNKGAWMPKFKIS